MNNPIKNGQRIAIFISSRQIYEYKWPISIYKDVQPHESLG